MKDGELHWEATDERLTDETLRQYQAQGVSVFDPDTVIRP